MGRDLPLRCRCGRVRGLALEVAPGAGFRFVCYCADCQAFARMLEQPEVLDAAGGTDILHMASGRVRISEGGDLLRCISRSSKVLRWYADCCRTPVGNTAATPRFPVTAVIHSFFDAAALDEALGPPRCRIFERSATGPLPPGAPPPPSFGVFARRGALVLGWWLRGLGRPTPFFDERTGAPRAAPDQATKSV